MTTPVYKTRKVDRSNGEKYKGLSLLPKHKIFLSHSGAQKEEFVEQLCVDLERNHRFPFFDKRPSSLPKGERFPILIKDVVAQCEMMVVVVSEEYFTSKWPMIELHAFMRASIKNPDLKVLPLFFGLNVEEFSNTCRQNGWLKVWEKMAKDDNRIKVDEWKQCVKWMGAFNGLVYDRGSKEIVTYRKEIVSIICKTIPSDVKYDESHVQGRSKLCQVVRQYFENIPNSVKMLGVRVIGLYGVGGMGKTQMCKLMCNELDREFDGKVCHVELGHESEHELVKKVLTTLTNTSVEVVQEVGKDKCRDILLDNKSWNQKTFLTIDNVWDDSNSLEQLKLFLRAPFVEGSWVIITSRCKNILYLEVDENACFEMPELEKDDARDMFLQHATNGRKFENTEDVYSIDKCIESCYFGKGGGQGSHYHPLSLKALGLFVYRHGGKQPSMWVKDLQKLKESSYYREPKNPVFTILRSNFDGLPKEEQELFMDIALFFPRFKINFGTSRKSGFLPGISPNSLMKWLCLVHNKKEKLIQDQLQHLVDNALLEDVDMSFGKVSIHDLYREFAKLESQGKLMPLDMEQRRWVYVEGALPNELEEEPRDCWNNLTRMCISWSYQIESPITSPRTIEWNYCKKLVVLNLGNLSELCGVLNFKDLICLRSLTLTINKFFTCESIEGLEVLENLTYFKMVARKKGDPSPFHKWAWFFQNFKVNVRKVGQGKLSKVGQLPTTLKILNVQANVLFEGDVLALCTNLVSLKLKNVCASELDLKNCTSLREVQLIKIKGLKVLQGFMFARKSSLQLLHISRCKELVEVCGLDCLAGLLSLHLTFNEKLLKLPSLTAMKLLHTLHCVWLDIDEVPGLDGLVGLKSLCLHGCPRLLELPSLTGLQCLHELDICNLDISELPNLSRLEQLQAISVCRNLQGFGDLPALTRIDLVGLKLLRLHCCPRLSKLPSFTGLQCLRKLEIWQVGISEIPYLSGLEQLQDIWVCLNEKLTSLQGFGDLPALTYIMVNWNEKLTSLQGFGDLPAIKSISLSGCVSLCQLPDMSGLTNLKRLDLRGTQVNCLKDMHMLEGLQILWPSTNA